MISLCEEMTIPKLDDFFNEKNYWHTFLHEETKLYGTVTIDYSVQTLYQLKHEYR